MTLIAVSTFLAFWWTSVSARYDGRLRRPAGPNAQGILFNQRSSQHRTRTRIGYCKRACTRSRRNRDMDGAVDTGEDGASARPRLFAPATQRERLLDGMARTVAEQGYAATSVADVLQAARISRRTFYERFADKEDCFIAAYDAIAEVCHARVSGAFNAAASWSDGIADGLDALLSTLAAEPAVRAAGGRRGARRRPARARPPRRDDAALRGLHTGQPRAVRRPALPHPDVVAQAIVGGIYELLYSRIVRGAGRATARALRRAAPLHLHAARNAPAFGLIQSAPEMRRWGAEMRHACVNFQP